MTELERDESFDSSLGIGSEPPALVIALQRLAEECARDDSRMATAPWTFDDRDAEIRAGKKLVASGGSVGYENARMTIDDDDAAGIVATRNRLPDLARRLTETATLVEALGTDLVDARTALRAPELHWECQQKLDKLEEELTAVAKPLDLSPAHVDRVARHLFRVFDDVNIGREPLHDFDVMLEGERGEHWLAMAREAIRRGAVVGPEGVP